MSDEELIVDSCRQCHTPIWWQECPTGGWWIHDEHPADHHDAIAPVPEVADE